MKRLSLIIIFSVLLRIPMALGQHPAFFINCIKAVGDTAIKYTNNFERQVGRDLINVFPCVFVNYQGQLRLTLKMEKEMQESGKSDGGKSLCKDLRADYNVTLEIIEIHSDLFEVTANCINRKKTSLIAKANLQYNGSINYGSLASACQQVSQKLIKELSEYEICPFKGPINIVVKEELQKTTSENYSVSCNGNDGLFKSEIKVNKHSESNWELNKSGFNKLTGNVKYSLYEEKTSEEQNDCFQCPSGRKGARLYTEENTKRATVEGLSDKSTFEGIKTEDAYAELEFLENGTFILMLKATSKKGDILKKSTRSASETCGNLNEPPKNETIKNGADTFVSFKTKPLPGTSKDKNLSGNDVIIIEDQVTKEKTSIKYDFNLKRD